MARANETGGYAGPSEEVLASQGAGGLVAGSTQLIRSVPDAARAVTWRIYRYATSEYPACLEAVALTATSGDYLGYVGGCGPKDRLNTDPYYFTGWVQQPAGERAYLSFGVIPAARAALVERIVWERVGSADRMTDRAVEGVWAFVTDSSVDARVKLLDAAQNVSASHRITPIQEAPR